MSTQAITINELDNNNPRLVSVRAYTRSDGYVQGHGRFKLEALPKKNTYPGIIASEFISELINAHPEYIYICGPDTGVQDYDYIINIQKVDSTNKNEYMIVLYHVIYGDNVPEFEGSVEEFAVWMNDNPAFEMTWLVSDYSIL